MEKIVSRPLSKQGLKNFDRIFRKVGVAQSVEQLPCKQRVEGSIPSTGSMLTTTGFAPDENIDWGGFKTRVCCTNDPHFGG